MARWISARTSRPPSTARRLMPTTRAARRAAAARQILELPADVLSLVLYQLTLAHDIAAVAPTCRVVCDAAKLAQKARPFSGEVVTLAGHDAMLRCVAAAPDGRIITSSNDGAVKIWRDGACVLTIPASEHMCVGVAMLPGGARFVSTFTGHDVHENDSAKLWTLDGALERTFEVGSAVHRSRRCPTACTLPSALVRCPNIGDVRLYHVDGTIVHTFQGHDDYVWALTVTPRRPAHHQRLD